MAPPPAPPAAAAAAGAGAAEAGAEALCCGDAAPCRAARGGVAAAAAAAKFCSSAYRHLIAGNSLSSSNREVKVLCFMVLEKLQFHIQWVQYVLSLTAFPFRYESGHI